MSQTSHLSFIQYARKSSESREKQALSIADQNSECDQYAQQHELNVVLKLEEAKSAYKPDNRHEFNKMLELIQKHQANAIMTWKADRLCRNPREGGQILQLLQDGVLQAIYTATGEVYLPDSDHLVLQIHFGMANQYSRNLSQNVKRGLLHKCQKGEYHNKAIVGFEGIGDRGRRNIQPHPFEAPIVKEVFTLASSSRYSLGYLTEYAYNKGLRTKRGKKISKSHLFNILTNTVYYGLFHRQGEAFIGTYTPIIDEPLFNKVQTALKIRSKPKEKSWVYPYRGLLKCGVCGCSIRTTVKEKHYKSTNRTARYTYYGCTHRKGNCTQPPLTAAELEELLYKELSEIGIDKEVWELGLEYLKAKHLEETTTNTKQLEELHRKSQGFIEKLSRLITMRADGELSKDEFLTEKEAVLKEQGRVKAFIKDCEDSVNNWINEVEAFLNTAYSLRDIMTNGTPEEKESVVKTVGENLTLKDKKLSITFKKPYDILLQSAYRTNVLGEWDSNCELLLVYLTLPFALPMSLLLSSPLLSSSLLSNCC